MSRTNAILAGILLLQLGLAAWLLRPAAGQAGAQPLIANVAPGDVTGVRISDGSGAVQLAKEGDLWSAPEADGYPVQAAGVTKLISDVLAIDNSRLVANTPASQARLKVHAENFARRIELHRANGDPLILYLGTSPNANATHVRLDGQDAVYLTTGVLAGEASSDLRGWIDTRYISANPDDVAQLEIFNANGRFTLVKGADGAWRLDDQADGESVDQEKAAILVSQLAGLQMVRPLGRQRKREYGLDTPQATATLELAGSGDGGKTITLDIGALDETVGGYIVKSSASEYYVVVGSFALQDLVEQTRTGLLAVEAGKGDSPP